MYDIGWCDDYVSWPDFFDLAVEVEGHPARSYKDHMGFVMAVDWGLLSCRVQYDIQLATSDFDSFRLLLLLSQDEPWFQLGLTHGWLTL